jgi:acylphosphatase
MGDVRLEAYVRGRVQGVGFRDWVRRAARPLQLAGSARNLPDGRVEVIAQGSREACEQLLAALRGGDPPGRVDDVQVGWADPRDGVTGFAAG